MTRRGLLSSVAAFVGALAVRVVPAQSLKCWSCGARNSVTEDGGLMATHSGEGRTLVIHHAPSVRVRCLDCGSWNRDYTREQAEEFFVRGPYVGSHA